MNLISVTTIKWTTIGNASMENFRTRNISSVHIPFCKHSSSKKENWNFQIKLWNKGMVENHKSALMRGIQTMRIQTRWCRLSDLWGASKKVEKYKLKIIWKIEYQITGQWSIGTGSILIVWEWIREATSQHGVRLISTSAQMVFTWGKRNSLLLVQSTWSSCINKDPYYQNAQFSAESKAQKRYQYNINLLFEKELNPPRKRTKEEIMDYHLHDLHHFRDSIIALKLRPEHTAFSLERNFITAYSKQCMLRSTWWYKRSSSWDCIPTFTRLIIRLNTLMAMELYSTPQMFCIPGSWRR